MQRTRDRVKGNKKNSLKTIDKMFAFIEANKPAPVCFAFTILPRYLASVKVKRAEASVKRSYSVFFVIFFIKDILVLITNFKRPLCSTVFACKYLYIIIKAL